MALAGAGLAGGKAVECSSSSGAVFDHAPKQVDHGLLIAPQRLLGPDHRRSPCLQARLALRTERGDAPGLGARTTRAHRSEGTGEVEEAHLDRAQGQARNFRKLCIDAEVSRSADHLIQSHVHGEAYGCCVDRPRERIRERDAPVLMAAEILWPPAIQL